MAGDDQVLSAIRGVRADVQQTRSELSVAHKELRGELRETSNKLERAIERNDEKTDKLGSQLVAHIVETKAVHGQFAERIARIEESDKRDAEDRKRDDLRMYDDVNGTGRRRILDSHGAPLVVVDAGGGGPKSESVFPKAVKKLLVKALPYILAGLGTGGLVQLLHQLLGH